MSGFRLPRLLLPALMTFAAGLLLGLQWASSRPQATSDPLPADLRAWHRGMVQSLELDQAQSQDLRLLLFHYSRQREELLAARFSAVDAEWQSLDQRFQGLLTTRILRPEQQSLASDLRQARTLAADLPPR